MSPYAADGGPQPALHTKHYIAMEQDIHYQKGMTCQDCHTSIDVHSDGFLAAANLASVQIECADCHGTPDKYPWELPLGFMDEFAMQPATGAPRGVLHASRWPIRGRDYVHRRARRLPADRPRQSLRERRPRRRRGDRPHGGRQGPADEAAQEAVRRKMRSASAAWWP